MGHGAWGHCLRPPQWGLDRMSLPFPRCHPARPVHSAPCRRRGGHGNKGRGAPRGVRGGLTSASALRSCVRRPPSSFTTFLAPLATAASMHSRCLSSSASSSGPGRRVSPQAQALLRPAHPRLSGPLTWFRGPAGLQAADLHSQQGHLQLAVPQHLLGSCQELPLLKGPDISWPRASLVRPEPSLPH